MPSADLHVSTLFLDGEDVRIPVQQQRFYDNILFYGSKRQKQLRDVGALFPCREHQDTHNTTCFVCYDVPGKRRGTVPEKR
jgi:hypothetical protein